MMRVIIITCCVVLNLWNTLGFGQIQTNTITISPPAIPPISVGSTRDVHPNMRCRLAEPKEIWRPAFRSYAVNIFYHEDPEIHYELPRPMDVESDNRSLNLDFVNEILTLQPISSFSFMPYQAVQGWKYPRGDKRYTLTQALNIQAHPIINLGGKNWYGRRSRGGRNPDKRARWLQTALLMPAVHIRINRNDNELQDYSLNVRTPSYLQGGAYFFTHSALWKRSKRMPDRFWKQWSYEQRANQILADTMVKNNWPELLWSNEWTDKKGNKRNVSHYFVHLHRGRYTFTNTNSFFGRLEGHHHSNGQDGWNRARGAWDQDSAYWNSDGTINTYNGDFGLNVVFEANIGWINERISKNKNWFWLHPNGKSLWISERKRVNYVLVGWQFVPYCLIGMKPLTEGHWYATNRLNVTWTYVQSKLERELSHYSQHITGRGNRRRSVKNGNSDWYSIQAPHYNEKIRFITELTYLADSKLRRGNLYDKYTDWVSMGDFKRRLNVSITGHKRIRGTGNASVFAQVGYYGSDPYNMQFMISRFFWRWGIGWGFFISGDGVRDYHNN